LPCYCTRAVATPPDTTVTGTVANQHRRPYLSVGFGRQIWPGCALRQPDLAWLRAAAWSYLAVPCSAALAGSSRAMAGSGRTLAWCDRALLSCLGLAVRRGLDWPRASSSWPAGAPRLIWQCSARPPSCGGAASLLARGGTTAVHCG